MSKNQFTQEEVDYLRTSIYVSSVSEKTIRYTDEMKELYYQRRDHYDSYSDTLRSFGLGPEVIGKKRASSLITNLNKYDSYEAYLEAREAKKIPAYRNDQAEIQALKHELSLTKQENKFLKKNLWNNQNTNDH